jgi:hypothetical protein
MSESAAPIRASEVTVKTRTLEMFLATVMCGYGAVLALPGDTLMLPHYDTIRHWVRIFPGNEMLFGMLILIVGLMRWSALIINGFHHSTPGLRLVGCLVGSVFWMTLTVSFVSASGLPGVPAALAWTAPAVVFEWFSIIRTTTDAFEANTFGVRTWAMKGRNGNEAGGTNDVRRRSH